jgi:hypothetical protein
VGQLLSFICVYAHADVLCFGCLKGCRHEEGGSGSRTREKEMSTCMPLRGENQVEYTFVS